MNHRIRLIVTVLALLSQAAMAGSLLPGQRSLSAGFAGGTGLPERVLHFPPGQSVGEIALIDESYVVPEVSREFHPGYVFAPSQYLGPARGEVRIPAGQCAIVHLGGKGVTRQQCLDALKSLGPNDVQDLDFLAPIQADDAFMPYVAKLTGMTHFCPVNARFTPKSWALPALLPRLEHICTPYGLTDADVAEIAKLQTVNEMEIVATRLTDVGLASLAKLRKLAGPAPGRHADDDRRGAQSPCHAPQAAASASLRPVHRQRLGLFERTAFAQGFAVGDPKGHRGGTVATRPVQDPGAAVRALV